jgi:2'-5' RNA ligase
MRCFIAIDLPEEVRENIYKINEVLKDINIKYKPVEKHNLHLTLKFLGEISDYKVNLVIDKIKKLKIKKFKASLGNIGFFPDENFIRVLWISLEPSSLIKKIHEEIDEALKQYFKKDKRFESHITIARIKNIKDRKEFLEKVRNVKIKEEFEVEEIKLKKSILRRDGPEYTDIYVFRLEEGLQGL